MVQIAAWKCGCCALGEIRGSGWLAPRNVGGRWEAAFPFAVAPAVQWWLRGSLYRQLPAMPATPLPAGWLVRRWVNAEALKIMVKSTALKRTAKIVRPRLWSGCGWAKRCALAVWRRIEPLESSGARTLLVGEHRHSTPCSFTMPRSHITQKHNLRHH